MGIKVVEKPKGAEDGVLIDGMDIAKKMYNENLLIGILLQLLKSGKNIFPISIDQIYN